MSSSDKITDRNRFVISSDIVNVNYSSRHSHMLEGFYTYEPSDDPIDRHLEDSYKDYDLLIDL